MSLPILVALLVPAVILIGALLWRRTKKRPRVCGNCAHFDLEEGQAAIAHFPVFRQYAQHVPPKRSGERYERDEAGEIVQTVTSPIPERCEWKDFGACRKVSVLVWQEQPVDIPETEATAAPCHGRAFKWGKHLRVLQ